MRPGQGKRWTVLTAAALLAVSGCQKPGHQNQQALTPSDVHIPALADLEAISLTSSQHKVVLKQEGQQWRVLTPEAGPVHPNRLENLWHRLAGLQAGKVMAPKKAAAVKKTYFHKTTAFQLSWQDKANHKDSLLGTSTQEGSGPAYVLHTLTGQVMRFDQAPWETLPELGQLVWKQLFPMPSTAMTGIEFRYQDNLIVLKKNQDQAGAWSMIQPQEQLINPDGLKRVLQFLKTSEYLEIKEETVWSKTVLSRYGLQKPVAQLAITLKQQRMPKVLEFGHVEDQPDVLFAKYQDDSKILSLSALFLKQCLMQLEQVCLDRTLIDFMSQVNKIKCDFPGKQLIAEHHDQTWIMVSPEDKPPGERRADAEVLAAFLSQLTFDNLVSPGSPDDRVFHSARAYGKIVFYSNYRDLLVELDFFQSDLYPEYMFIKNNSNGKVMIIALEKLKPYLINY